MEENQEKIQEKNIVEGWLARSNAVGKSLSDVCRMADVNRKTIERWKFILPKPVQYFLKMERTLGELESK